MIYLYCLIMLVFFTFLGKVTINLLDIKRSKHDLVYGAFTYFSGFFIISGVFTFLHLSWSIYTIIMYLYNIVLLGIICFHFFTKKISLDFSIKNIKKYFRENWLVLICIAFFTFMCFASYNTLYFSFFGGDYSEASAMIDDYVYLARAANNIGANQIYPPNMDIVSGSVTSGSDILLNVAFLELFWGFFSEFFHVSLLSFTRTLMTIVIYFWSFLAIDEVMFLYSDKKQYKKIKYAILSILLLYFVSGLQNEIYKFMYLPWFGNVFTSIIYLPLLLVFMYQAINNKRSLLLLFLAPFISVGFSSVSILYTTFIFIPVMLYWYKYKTYNLKYEKFILLGSLFFVLIFGITSFLPNYGEYLNSIGDIWRDNMATYYSEKGYFFESFRYKFWLILPGIILFFIRFNKKETKTFENVFIIFSLGLVFLALVPKMGTIFFNLFSFPYRRLLETLLLYLMLYSFIQIILSFKKFRLRELMVSSVILAIVIFRVSGVYLLNHTEYFALKNFTSEERIQEATSQLIHFLETTSEKQDEKQYICYLPDRAMLIKDDTAFIDLGVASSVVSNNFMNCFIEEQNDGTSYLVLAEKLEDFSAKTHEEKTTKLFEKYDLEKLALAETITTDELDLYIYVYNH